MVDTALQRTNMVESQVRPSDVTDRRVIRAMLAVDREAFLPADLRAIAYMDGELRLKSSAGTRTLLAPRTLARLLQLAEVDDNGAVLVVGAATGYTAALLARFAGRVVALEQDAVLAEAAARDLAALKTVTVVKGDHAAGAAEQGPFDAIVVEGLVDEVPAGLLDQLKDGGRLVAIVARGAMGQAVAWQRLGAGFDRTNAFDASAGPLPGFQKAAEFSL